MQISYQQQTVDRACFCSGVGIHSGKQVNLAIKPAPVNHGIKFIRTDLPGKPCIPAHFNKVVDTSLATVIGSEGCIVSTIEHLMASFAGLAVDNAIVELDGYEMPIMDGSAKPFTTLIKSGGIKKQDAPRCFLKIKKPIELRENGKFVAIYPSVKYKITCSIEYDHPLIKKQTSCFDISDTVFEKEIAPARTFGFLHEYEYLKLYGLARGGSLDNVVVIDKNNILNPGGLRYKDEFVRHKMLDCMGDFSLMGLPLIGHVKAFKSGHAFNHALLKKIFSEKNCWETLLFQNT